MTTITAEQEVERLLSVAPAEKTKLVALVSMLPRILNMIDSVDNGEVYRTEIWSVEEEEYPNRIDPNMLVHVMFGTIPMLLVLTYKHAEHIEITCDETDTSLRARSVQEVYRTVAQTIAKLNE